MNFSAKLEFYFYISKSSLGKVTEKVETIDGPVISIIQSTEVESKPRVESITEDNVESNCSMTRKNPPKRVSFSDLICIFAMLCQSFACFLFATLR